MQDEKNLTIYDIINTLKKNRKKVNTKLILKAYNFAKGNHGEQIMHSKKDYLVKNISYIL